MNRLGLIIALFASLFGHSYAQANLNCEASFQIVETFSNGARWEMCRINNQRENLILADVHYVPADGSPYRVLSSARLSQLHVAYDDSNVTYNDITQFGLGGAYMSTLTEDDCPGGQLLEVEGRAGVCLMRSVGQDLYRTPLETRQAESLLIFSVSQVGSYSYTVSWKFFSDGSIQPSIGAAGALQRSSRETLLPFGRQLEGITDKSWLSHTHNYYWRLDFDLGSSATDDKVIETSWPLSDGGRRIRQETAFEQEAARAIDPESMRMWSIIDGSTSLASESTPPTSFQLSPVNFGHRLVRESREPFTAYDFFVTRQNDCERYANNNEQFNPGCGETILDFVDGESLTEEDIVVWHRISFHHLPRNEDRSIMHSHWDGFLIEPQYLNSTTPGHSGVIDNTAPSIEPIEDRTDAIDRPLSLSFSISDADDDAIRVSATGLPDGLIITDSGEVSGSASAEGEYAVLVIATDGIAESTESFQWTITDGSDGGGSGSFGVIGLMLLCLPVLGRRRHDFGRAIGFRQDTKRIG